MKYAIVSNYQNNHTRQYVDGWPRAFAGEGLSTGFQIEDYLCEVLKDKSYQNLMVKQGKALARKLGIKIGDADAIAVNKKQLDAINKHFAPELNKTYWVVTL